ncbi:hypothetical protein BGZ98_004508 [Dissophora globulifera]|nr:hypothetical protein BGZ98_004508 [Dissophora globulifera]
MSPHPDLKAKPAPLPFAYLYLAGAIAGVTEITCMYPLDLVKTRLQLQTTSTRARGTIPVAAVTTTTKTVPYTSILDCLRRVVQQEGSQRLYRGVLPLLVAEAPRRAIKFGVNEQWGLALKKLLSIDQFSATQAGFVGSLTGATEAFFVTPFEFVKVRLQDPQSLGKYSGAFDCMRKVTTEEGVFTFFHGIESTVWRHTTWSGFYFMSIHVFRMAFPERSNSSKQERLLKNFIAGTIGGTLGVLVSTPFDVIKSRVQNQRRENAKFRALYKGLAPKLVRLGLGGGLLLVTFDVVSELMRRHLAGQTTTIDSLDTS